MTEALRIRLNTLLLQNNISKIEFARQLGGTYSYVADILNGRRRPSRNYAEKIAAALGADPRELFVEWEPGLFEPFGNNGAE